MEKFLGQVEDANAMRTLENDNDETDESALIRMEPQTVGAYYLDQEERDAINTQLAAIPYENSASDDEAVMPPIDSPVSSAGENE